MGDETADVLTPEQRRWVMSQIKGKDTKPEILMRRGLHRRGLRYKLHQANMPGKPDMVFPKYRAVVFVHGCFWHGHGCSLFKWPKTRAAFWKAKINRNIERDREVRIALKTAEWRVIVIWECALRGKYRRALPGVLHDTEAYIRHGREFIAEIAENNIRQRDTMDTPQQRDFSRSHTPNQALENVCTHLHVGKIREPSKR